MRFLMIPAFLGATALAMPAMAAGGDASAKAHQNQAKAGQTQAQTQQGQTQQGQMQQSQTGKSSGTQAHAMSQDKLRSSLQNAGFSNVTIVDAAYLVRAQSQDGDQVVMFINPPRSSGSAQMSGASGSSQSQAQSDQKSKSGSSTTTR